MKNKLLCITVIVLLLGICIGVSAIQNNRKIEQIKQHEQTEKIPVVSLQTNGAEVPGKPVLVNGERVGYETTEDGKDYIVADFVLDEKESGTVFKSDARIHYRGNSSRYFHKKSYSIQLIDKNEHENKQNLLEMGNHDEWVLNGPFLDRTLIRNYFCLSIAGEIMEYAPEVRYCELYVDDEYQGLYLLMEKVSAGEERIRMTKSENGSPMTSYIVCWDRAGKGDFELDNYVKYIGKAGISGLDVRYPGKDNMTETKFDFIEKDISRIERELYLGGDYSQYIDVNSFAQYFVINELFRNVDAGRFSTYYYKDLRGKVKACVWDFNNACDNYMEASWTEEGFNLQNAPWFEELLKDRMFVDTVIQTYEELRKEMLSEEYLVEYIDEITQWLQPEIYKNYEKWGYVFNPDEYEHEDFPDNFLNPVERNYTSYEEALEQLKDFIIRRGNWLDENIESLYGYCDDNAQTKNDTHSQGGKAE